MAALKLLVNDFSLTEHSGRGCLLPPSTYLVPAPKGSFIKIVRAHAFNSFMNKVCNNKKLHIRWIQTAPGALKCSQHYSVHFS